MSEQADSWAQRVRDAREAKESAGVAYEQTIRDAHQVGDMSALDIAKAMGIKDRTQITRYLHAEAPAQVPAVRLPVVISPHGAGNSDRAWAALRAGIAARGWLASDDNQAWHLSRAGAKVVRLFWHADSEAETVTVDLVRAVHSQPAEHPVTTRLAEFLPTRAGIQLRRDHPEVADWLVTQYEDYTETWRVLASRTEGRPTNTTHEDGKFVTRVDTDKILARVAALLDQS